MNDIFDVWATAIIVMGVVSLGVLALFGFSMWEGRERELIEARLDLMEEKVASRRVREPGPAGVEEVAGADEGGEGDHR